MGCGKETFWFLLIFFIRAFASITGVKCSTTTDSSMLLDLRAGKPLNWFRTFCDLWRWVVAAKHSNRLKVRARPHSKVPPRTNFSNIHKMQDFQWICNLQIFSLGSETLFFKNLVKILVFYIGICEINFKQTRARENLKVIFIDLFSSKNIILFLKICVISLGKQSATSKHLKCQLGPRVSDVF